MKITIESTNETYAIPDSVAVRMWVGTTEQGHPVKAFVVGLRPINPTTEALEELAADLQGLAPGVTAKDLLDAVRRGEEGGEVFVTRPSGSPASAGPEFYEDDEPEQY